MNKSITESDITKRKILYAAKKVFAERGFDGARMNSIATIACVNQALLHYHFDTKKNLYNCLFEYFIGDSSRKFSEFLENEFNTWSIPVEEKLCAIIYLIVSVNLEAYDVEMNRIFIRETLEGSGLLNEFIKKYFVPIVIKIERIIQDGISESVFEISNPKLFTFNLLIFITHSLHLEEFLMDTELHAALFKDRKSTFYKYLLEQTFKSLRPSDKPLIIPKLSRDKSSKIDSFVKMIYDFIYDI
ncbi:MAG: TetR/AcrR family transcriptional regulator [Leptospirales bacterium]|nr:TetR/AcrR family transcriptional regulator [Leptospirales bacterium]